MVIVCGGGGEVYLVFLFSVVTTSCTTSTSTHAGLATTTEPRTDATGYHGNATGSSSSSSREAADETMPDEQRLLRRLLRSYDPGIRPVFNVTRNVVVNFSLTLVQIMDMVSVLMPMLMSMPVSIVDLYSA